MNIHCHFYASIGFIRLIYLTIIPAEELFNSHFGRGQTGYGSEARKDPSHSDIFRKSRGEIGQFFEKFLKLLFAANIDSNFAYYYSSS